MIRLIPLLLVACSLNGKNTTIVEGCDIVESYAPCPSSCVAVPDGAYPAFVMQCGGSGTASNPGEEDDCVEAAEWSYQNDSGGDMICGICDSEDSGTYPWTYLWIGFEVCDFDTGETSSISVEVDEEMPTPPSSTEEDAATDSESMDWTSGNPNHPRQHARASL